MLKKELIKIIEMSWTKETCYPKLQNEWTEKNKSLGQSAITALIVNMFLGGKIMRCNSELGNHYYNLVNNELLDLTCAQFKSPPFYNASEERSIEYILSNDDTKNRYKILLENVKENFIKYGAKKYKLIDSNGKNYLSHIPGTIGGNKKLKIYGKLDCPNALIWIKKGYYTENRVFFENIEVAKLNNYRPCAKCMKKEFILWKNNKDR